MSQPTPTGPDGPKLPDTRNMSLRGSRLIAARPLMLSFAPSDAYLELGQSMPPALTLTVLCLSLPQTGSPAEAARGAV
jgi:hypothetical protein